MYNKTLHLAHSVKCVYGTRYIVILYGFMYVCFKKMVYRAVGYYTISSPVTYMYTKCCKYGRGGYRRGGGGRSLPFLGTPKLYKEGEKTSRNPVSTLV